MKCFIVSQPKSGTYLCANLLTEFGLQFEGYHISQGHYQKHDVNDVFSARQDRRQTKIKSKLSQSLTLVKENYFGVGHLEFNSESEKVLFEFKKILLLRDLQTSKESWYRWARIQNKSNDTKNLDIDFRQNIAKWNGRKNVYTLNFFDMKNCDIKKIDGLQNFLFGDILYDSQSCITNALNENSFTKV